jgi:hypothetical protein
MNYTRQEVAELERVSVKLVDAWIRSGELRAHVSSLKMNSRKRRVRISAESLEAFRLSRTIYPPAPRVRRRRRLEEPVKHWLR